MLANSCELLRRDNCLTLRRAEIQEQLQKSGPYFRRSRTNTTESLNTPYISTGRWAVGTRRFDTTVMTVVDVTHLKIQTPLKVDPAGAIEEIKEDHR